MKFNGVSAQYLVQSSTKIYTRVPPGATSGKVQGRCPRRIEWRGARQRLAFEPDRAVLWTYEP